MGTRCLIGCRLNDGIHSFYCHFDGYPEGVGKDLCFHYNSERKVRSLIRNCEPYGISSLYSTEERTLEERYINDGTQYPVYKNKTEYVRNAPFDVEYIYLWEDEQWKIFSVESPTLYEERIDRNIRNGRFKPLLDRFVPKGK